MGGRGFAAYWKALCSALEQHHYILLYKGPATGTTRRPGRLIARIDAPAEMRVRAGERARVPVRIRNIGDTRWVSAEGPGWTRVGAHLYRATTAADLVDFDWYRASLPFDVDPAAQVHVDLLLPATPTSGEFLLRLDLVVEGLTWFSDRGSPAATMRLTVEP
jgi:hypothetical protein